MNSLLSTLPYYVVGANTAMSLSWCHMPVCLCKYEEGSMIKPKTPERNDLKLVQVKGPLVCIFLDCHWIHDVKPLPFYHYFTIVNTYPRRWRSMAVPVHQFASPQTAQFFYTMSTILCPICLQRKSLKSIIPLTVQYAMVPALLVYWPS